MVRGGNRKLSTRTEYPEQWERILQLSMQTEWSREDEEEIDYLNDNYFGEFVLHEGLDYTGVVKNSPRGRSHKITVTRPNGEVTMFNSKKDAMKVLGMSFVTITKHIEQEIPVTKYGWYGCIIKEIVPGEDKAILAIAPDGTKQKFDNALEASKVLGMSPTSVGNSIRENRPIKHGRVKGWKFKEVDK